MTNTITSISGAVVALALVAAVAVLTWHGSIDGQGALAFFGVIAGAGTAAGVGHVATKTTARALNNKEGL